MPKPKLSAVDFPVLKKTGGVNRGTVTSPDAARGFVVVIDGQASKRWIGSVVSKAAGANKWNAEVSLLPGPKVLKKFFGIEGIAVTITNPTTLETSIPPIISTTTIP
jgi:hypothetical protein